MCYRIAVAAYSVFILGSASVAAAEDVTAKGQVSVTFTVPYQELLQGEFRPNSTIELTNNSMDTLYYIPDGSWADVLQIFIKVDRAIPIPGEHRNGMYDPDIETYGLWERVREFASSELKPGESVAWEATNIPYPVFALSPSRKPKSIRAQVLIGPAQWVSSKPVPITFINQGVKEFPVVFKDDYLTGPQRAKSSIAVYRVAIQNKEYLFTSSCFRICEIPKDSKPEFIWEPRLGLLKIDFRLDEVPVVWFHYPMLERLDSDKSRTEFYRQKYIFEYGDADYRERAMIGMASHGTAASVQLFDEYGGSNELLLQHRDRYECMRLLLDRAGKMEDVEQSRQLLRQTLFADELQLDSKEKIAPDLSSLNDSDIQILARDALVRFASTYTRYGRFRLARLDCLNFYIDSKENPGKLEWVLRDDKLYEPGVREAFGDYDSLPHSVREVVLNENAPVLDGEQYPRPLGLKTITWSKEQRRVQVTLDQPRMPSMSYTFLYRVEPDGALRFIRSQPMGCSYPEGFIKETSEQESQLR